MKIAIVILNWNGRAMMEKFLPSVAVFSQSDDAEIIVADNGSTDDSLAFLSQKYPNIRQIKLDKNYGFAQGYNLALAQIDAQYFLLLNSDIEVSENWLLPLVSFLDNDADYAAVMPKIISYSDKKKFEYAGAAGGFIDKYGYPFCRGRILSNTESDMQQYNNACSVFWTTGACMLVRSQVFRQVGGFDGDFFAHMEEIDLCWRISHLGYKLAFVPDSRVFHVGGGTLEQGNSRKLFLNYRNNLFMLYKNLPTRKFKRTLAFRMFMDGLSALIYLFTLRFKYFASVLKAHFDFYKSRKTLKNKRAKILSNSVVENVPNVYPHSIVLKFFVSKKRLAFSDLNFKNNIKE